MANYTPMINQYLQIKSNYQDAFLFFRLGDFYEMFFDDAELASKLLEITLTARDGGNTQKIPMCGVPYHSAEAYISRLIENGYKVAVCEQVEDPKVAKGVVKREVVRVITPGTVMEGKKLESKTNNYIASLTYNQDRFGLSLSDVSTGEFYATEIIGNIDQMLTELNQYQPSEIILTKEIYEKHVADFKHISTTLSVVKDLSIGENRKLVADQFNHVDIDQMAETILSSVGQLLRYLNNTQQKKLHHFNQLRIYETNQYMVLDVFSKRNLELVKTTRDQVKKGSLLWMLDHTETAMGSRLLRRWLEKPLLSKEIIEKRFDGVEALVEDIILLEDLKQELKQMYDIERIISKVVFGNATPKDLYALRGSLEKVPNIVQVIKASKAEAIQAFVEEIDVCQDIATFIKQSIQDDPPISSKDGSVIKRDYDQKLDEYYTASKEGKHWLRQLEQRERETTGIKSLKVGFNKVFGYYIEVTKSNLSQVPNERYIRKQTLANAERYFTEELKEKETLILDAEEKMLDLEYQLFVGIREHIGDQTDRLQLLAQKIANIDVLIAFASVSVAYNYVRPALNLEGRIIVKDGRHPVIEAVQDRQAFMPNDVVMNQDSQQILMITGPNMAGKSTYMRQIAITVIMAQIGCFVPASSADIAIIDRIFTRIGAGDDLTSGQSTFMVEMMETKQAITQATQNSLILLDEIGRGTSTYDGMALAQAILQYIHEHVKAKTLFSTHYHELTSLESHYARMENIHVNVTEKDGKVIFLHKIEKGRADKSYGIHVAELAGIPEGIIQDAKVILKELEAKAFDKNEEQIQFDLFEASQEKQVVRKENKEDKLYKSIANQIDSLDLINMTPMEGFNILFDIQKRLRK